MRKILIVFTVLVAVLIITTGAIHAAEFAGGNGTVSNPWRISTPEHLNNIRNYLGSEHSDKHFMLINDIDLSGYLDEGGAGHNDGAGWIPIIYREYVDPWSGWQTSYFEGTLNGNGYIIRNLYIDCPGDSFIGLFGGVRDAVINSLGLENVAITGRRNVGGLVGYATGSSIITDCYVNGSVESIDSSAYTGGLVGELWGTSKTYNSYFVGSVTSNGDYTGGLVGYNYQSSFSISISNSYAIATVSSNGDMIGGLVGHTSETKIINSFARGSVIGRDSVGGLMGSSYIADIENCFADADVDGRDRVGGLIGLKRTNTLSNSYALGEVNGSSGVGGLVGQQNNDHYRDSNIINSYASVQVSGDSDLGGLVGWQVNETAAREINIVNSYYDSSIAGLLDTGKGEPKTTEQMQSQSTYDEWDFDDAWRIGDHKNNGYPYLYTAITAASSNADHGGTYGSGSYSMGEQVTVSAAVYGEYRFSHWTEGSLIVNRSSEYSFYALGDRTLTANFGQFEISTTAYPAAGGYAAGTGIFSLGETVTVTAVANTGYSFANWTVDGTEVSSEAAYTFTATDDRELTANFVPNQYLISAGVNPTGWGIITGASTYFYGDAVTLLAQAEEGYHFVNWTEDGIEISTAQAYSFTASGDRTLSANFAQYSITTAANPVQGGNTSGDGAYNAGDIVTVNADANAGYTFVNWTEGEVIVSTEQEYTFTTDGNHDLTANFDRWFAGGSGSENDPFLIETAAHLNNIRQLLGISEVYFMQTADIDLQGIWSEGEGWEPIGEVSSDSGYFRGKYDGNGHKILNLTINRPETDYVGLIGIIELDAEVKNIFLEDVNVRGGGAVGSLAGAIYSGRDELNIINIHSSGSVMGNNSVGGLIGVNYDGRVLKCSSKGTVTGISTDDFRGISYNTGGLVGVNDGTIEESYSEADVSGAYHVGGIAGTNESPKTIINSFAVGTVTGENRVGGLLGLNGHDKTVINSYAAGTVTGSENVGSLIGTNNGIVTSSYYKIEANPELNGVGSGNHDIIVGLTDEQMQEETYYVDWDFDAVWALEEYPLLKWQVEPTYIVTFKDWDETVLKVETVVHGSNATSPADPTREGYIFMGWDVEFTNVTENLTITAQYQTSSRGGSSNNNETIPTDERIYVQVDGRVLNAGIVKTLGEGSRRTKLIEVNDDYIYQRLADQPGSPIILIPYYGIADAVIGEFSGNSLKELSNRGAIVEVRNDRAAYLLPIKEINMEKIINSLGDNIELSNLRLQIEISSPTEEQQRIIQNLSRLGGFTIIGSPVEFKVRVLYQDRDWQINEFNSYVSRMLTIPGAANLESIITGVTIDNNGIVRHVPTKIVAIEGKNYAVINSLTNSSYAVISNQLELIDVSEHWAKETVNNMGSRMIINGVGQNRYEPNRDINRAEFAAIIVRALGLKLIDAESPFADVKNTEWYYEAVNTAYKHGIITGYDNKNYHPLDKLTREQAITMIARAMNITELNVVLAEAELNEIIAAFTDGDSISEYAKGNMAVCVKSGIISGRGDNFLFPRSNITRAEVAVMIQRLLEKSNLI